VGRKPDDRGGEPALDGCGFGDRAVKDPFKGRSLWLSTFTSAERAWIYVWIAFVLAIVGLLAL
jgi:hypothetical protein